MTQPSFVPIAEADQVRRAHHLHVPEAWSTHRPAEVTLPLRTRARSMGTPGPDQGFALKLARRYADRLVLHPGEDVEDVLVGSAMLAAHRAAGLGRAPCAPDLTWALSAWGFLGEAPADLVARRRQAFAGAAHDYAVQRALVDGEPAA
ncbi:MAG: hypothetical protein M0Z95_16810 [Actinomycetota bacterium]|jgi:hypothetical protein|nr:hypothetical protein [Actinomycetota bacterium]